MPNPPFKPPEANPKRKPPRPGEPSFVGSPVRAILTGLTIDIGGSMVINIILAVAYHVQLSNSGLSEAQIATVMQNITPQSTIAIVSTLLGALCSVAGGFACARIVRRDEFRIGGVMASLSGFITLAWGGSDLPDDLIVLLTLSTVACVLLGVKYGRESNRREAAPATPPPNTPKP
jgi:hypothetical protein